MIVNPLKMFVRSTDGQQSVVTLNQACLVHHADNITLQVLQCSACTQDPMLISHVP